MSEAKKLNADSVEHIRITQKDLKGDFKTELSRFKNIKSLSFKGLKLDSLDIDFKTFSQLNYLDLSKNRFVLIPEGICEIKSLKILLLSSNPLAELPECMGNLTRLTALDCFDTELEAFPESMKSCTSLKYVDMQGIQLNQDKQNAIKALFSNVRFNFDEPCNCL